MCRIVETAGHPSGRHRSGSCHQPATGLAQRNAHSTHRPLELLSRAVRKLEEFGGAVGPESTSRASFVDITGRRWPSSCRAGEQVFALESFGLKFGPRFAGFGIGGRRVSYDELNRDTTRCGQGESASRPVSSTAASLGADRPVWGRARWRRAHRLWPALDNSVAGCAVPPSTDKGGPHGAHDR
jgi:hypothetical protein